MDADELIKKIDKVLCVYAIETQLRCITRPSEKDPTAPVVKEVFGPSGRRTCGLGFRTPAVDTRDAVVLDLIGQYFLEWQGRAF